MTTKQHSGLIHFEEAMKDLNAIKDPITNQLVNMAVNTVLHRFASGVPEGSLESDFDLRFFVQIMKECFSRPSVLKRILEGEDLRWFSDENSDEKENLEITNQKKVPED